MWILHSPKPYYDFCKKGENRDFSLPSFKDWSQNTTPEGKVLWNGVDITHRPEEMCRVLGYLQQRITLRYR